MPGDRKHHTDKFRRCVEQVTGKGHDESSAYAICTTSLQNAGEPIFEAAEEHPEVDRVLAGSEQRSLHLLGAIGNGTGQVRRETLNGRSHLVVPVVALMEGVIHAVNADTPEFVPGAVLRKAAASWVGKPVTLGHPAKDGRQCSASDATVRKAHGIGVVMKSEVDAKNRLCQELWLDEEKTKSLHPKMYETLSSGGTEEVSVGAMVVTKDGGGTHNGKLYKGTWLETSGDHLAILPGQRGACSCEMGCGTNRVLRAAMHVVTDGAIEPMVTQTLVALEGQSLDERIQMVAQAVDKKWNKRPAGGGGINVAESPSDYAYPLQVFDDRVIVRKGSAETFSLPYAIEDGEVVLGEAVEVKQQWVALGDFDGHPFRGNQHTDGEGGDGGDGESEKNWADTSKPLQAVTFAHGADAEGKRKEAVKQIHKQLIKAGFKKDSAEKVHTPSQKMGRSTAYSGTYDKRETSYTDDSGRKAVVKETWGKYADHTVAVRHSSERELASASYKECPMCQGTGSKSGNPCEACGGEGELKAAAERIRAEGGKYVLYSSDGRLRLAEHASRVAAEEHQRAMEARLATA